MQSWLSLVLNPIDLVRDAEEHNPFIGKFTSIELSEIDRAAIKNSLKEAGINYNYKIFKVGDKYIII